MPVINFERPIIIQKCQKNYPFEVDEYRVEIHGFNTDTDNFIFRFYAPSMVDGKIVSGFKELEDERSIIVLGDVVLDPEYYTSDLKVLQLLQSVGAINKVIGIPLSIRLQLDIEYIKDDDNRKRLNDLSESLLKIENEESDKMQEKLQSQFIKQKLEEKGVNLEMYKNSALELIQPSGQSAIGGLTAKKPGEYVATKTWQDAFKETTINDLHEFIEFLDQINGGMYIVESTKIVDNDYNNDPEEGNLSPNLNGQSSITDPDDHLGSLASGFLIGDEGRPHWANIRIMKNHKFDVFAGESDSFGWLTGVVRLPRGLLIFFG
jgi:hypothetical protein